MLGSLDEDSDINAPLIDAFANRESNASVDFDSVCKVIIVGDSAVGKSSLFRRFSSDSFSSDHVVTDSVEFGHRFIDTLTSRCKVCVYKQCTSRWRAVYYILLNRSKYGIV